MEKQKKKTPEKIRVGNHIFKRYLFDNEYAEELKCDCGFVIWACYTEEEAAAAVQELDGDINDCRYGKIHKKESI